MSDLTPKDVLEEYLAERDAAQFSINAGLLPDKWEREFQRTHDALALALARIEALEKEAATLHAALMVFEAGWSTGGYLDPLDFWDKCFKRLNDLVPPEHRSFVWAVEQEMRDRAALRREEER